jgi:CDK inhibitor PHO81
LDLHIKPGTGSIACASYAHCRQGFEKNTLEFLLTASIMKFGKHIQKRQLEIPEYAASFVDYKALKKLIKKLSATPVIPPQSEGFHHESLDPQSSLQANKATFFFRVERELEKVNTFYLQKEAELRLRLTTLLDKKRVMQQHPQSVSKTSSRYVALEEGLKQFSMDLNKLEVIGPYALGGFRY